MSESENPAAASSSNRSSRTAPAPARRRSSRTRRGSSSRTMPEHAHVRADATNAESPHADITETTSDAEVGSGSRRRRRRSSPRGVTSQADSSSAASSLIPSSAFSLFPSLALRSSSVRSPSPDGEPPEPAWTPSAHRRRASRSQLLADHTQMMEELKREPVQTGGMVEAGSDIVRHDKETNHDKESTGAATRRRKRTDTDPLLRDMMSVSARARSRSDARPPPLRMPDKDDVGAEENGYDNGDSSPPSSWLSALCCASGRGSLSWIGLAVVFSVLAMSSLALHVVIDFLYDRLEPFARDWLAATALILALLAVPLTHGLAGRRKNGPLSYTFWQPFVGGMRFVLLQVLAWTMWTLTLVGGAYGLWVGTKKLTVGWFSAVGVSGVLSQLLVLISLHFFVSNASGKQRERQEASRREGMERYQIMDQRQIEEERTIVARAAAQLEPEGKMGEKEEEEKKVAVALPALRSMPVPIRVDRTARTALAAKTSIWPFGSVAMRFFFLVLASSSMLLALFMESMTSRGGASVSSIQSFLTSAILLAVPLTHLLARQSLTHAGYLLFQPFKGGRRFVLLQALAWTLWTLAFISAGTSFLFVALQQEVDGTGVMIDRLDPVLARDAVDQVKPSSSSWRLILSLVTWLPLRGRQLSQLVTGAGVGAILSQMLVLISLKYFDARISKGIINKARVLEIVRRISQEQMEREEKESGLELTQQQMEERRRKQEQALYGRAVELLSSPHALRQTIMESPHIAAGTTRTARAAGVGLESPFTWDIASPAMSPHKLKQQPHQQQQFPSPPSPLGAAVSPHPHPHPHASFDRRRSEEKVLAGLAAKLEAEVASKQFKQIVPEQDDMDRTLSRVEPESEVEELLTTASPEPPSSLSRLTLGDLYSSLLVTWHEWRSLSLRERVVELLKDVNAFFVIAFFYFIPMIGAFITFGPPLWLIFGFIFGRPVHWLPCALYGTIAAFYATTYRNRPSVNGTRSWDVVRRNELLWGGMQRYFQGELLALAPLNPATGPYIFGFHPHGVYPLTCFWATRGPAFRQAFPGLDVDICGASVVFYAPFMRDICMWTGAREVSGTAIQTALRQKRSIMLVPGGQREMRHSEADPNILTLVTRHRGFVRMALQHGTPLVPVLSIGETMLLQNVRAPRLQAYSLRTVGVGFPIWPYGRWYSPLPNPHPVLVIFGHPLVVPKTDHPSQTLIEEVHEAYFKQLKAMFMTHRHRVPGFEECKLVFTED